MISGASIDRCVHILLTTFYHMHHYTMQLLGRWSRVHISMAYRTHPIVNVPYTPMELSRYRKISVLLHCVLQMEWIYTRTKIRGQDSLELYILGNEKKRKIEKWAFFGTSGSGMY